VNTVAALSNNPPPDADPLRERLERDHAAELARASDLLDAYLRVPASIDAESIGRASDFVKQLTGALKTLDKIRQDEKEPYLDGGRRIDSFFKTLTEKLDRAKRDVADRAEKHLRAVAEAERIKRAEAERAARAEAEALRRAADEAARSMATSQQMPEVFAKDEAARLAEAEAARKAAHADASAAEMSRTRSDYGSTATLRTSWTFAGLDQHSVDLEPLRPYLPMAAIEQAVRAFIKAGHRELRGVKIIETSNVSIR